MKNKIIVLGIFLMLFGLGKVKAQELANYNLYMQNNYLYNPAYTINDDRMSAFLNSHIQWVGFDGAPVVNTFGVHGAITKNSGLGLSVMNNSVGVLNSFNANLNYGYRAQFGDEHFLHLGLGAGFSSDKVSGINEYADITDETITNSPLTGTGFAATAGMAYLFKGLEVQFIMPQIYQRKEVNLYSIGILAYNYDINQIWQLKPSVQGRGVSTSPMQYDANLMGTWKDMLWAQAGYRTNKSMIFSAGVRMMDLDLGYAYQTNSGELTNASSGTHEIQLIYNFGPFKRKVKTVLSGDVTNSANNDAVVSKITIYENDLEIFTTNSSDSAGYYMTKLKPGRSYTIKSEAEGFFPEMQVFAIAEKDELEKEVNIVMIPTKATVSGVILRKDNNRPIDATVTAFENGVEVASTSTDASTGQYSFEMLSGKTYLMKVEATKYIAEQGDFSIPSKQLKFSKNFSLKSLVTVLGTITDAKDGAKVSSYVNIYKAGKLLETLSLVDNFNKVMKKEGTYEFEFKAADYLTKKITFNLNGAADELTRNIKLTKINKGEALDLGVIEFKSGTAQLTTTSFKTLDKLVKIMSNTGELKVKIDGHTDSDGSASLNNKVSKLRANACVTYLISKGINASRISSEGFGEAKPIKPNNTPENKAKNRRVEFKFVD